MQEEEVRRSFQRGNALFERNWLYAWNLHQQAGSAVRGRIGLTALPRTPGAPTAATLGGWHLGISKTSDAKDRAWQLTAFLLSREIQTRLLLTLGWYSGRRDVYTTPEVRRKVANVDQLREIVAHAVSRPTLAHYDHVSLIVQRYVNDCLAGKRAPGPAIAAMQREIDRIGGFYGQP
jgi:multiple sugar transport system substrate-binding protein